MQHHYCIHTTVDPTVSGLNCSDKSEKQLMQYCLRYVSPDTHVCWNSSCTLLSEQNSLASWLFIWSLSRSEICIFNYRTCEKLLVGMVPSVTQPISPFWSYREENRYSDVPKWSSPTSFTPLIWVIDIGKPYYNNLECCILQTRIGLWIYCDLC